MGAKSDGAGGGDSSDTYRVYWQVQYDRVAQHENGRYQVSAYVLAGSLVALGFITQSSAQGWVRLIATAGVAMVNVLAVVFIAGERRWIKVHQARAAAALQKLAPELVALQDEVTGAAGFAGESASRNALLRSSNVLAAMHLVVATRTILIATLAQTK